MINTNHGTLKIPEGYKQTEVGIIPDDWKIKILGEVAIIKSGGTPSTNIPQYWDGGVAWCTPTDITSLNGKYLLNTVRTISKEGLQNSSAELLPINTIIMTSRATIGECAIAKIELATNQGFKNFICSDFISYEFLFYLLTSLKDSFISLCSGSTFLEISTTQIRKFSVSIPPLKEQTAIANALSDVDALIAELEKLIAKKEAIKTGAMQQLLTGKTRLPQFVKRGDGTVKGYKDSELGKIPEDWEVVMTSDVSELLTGYPFESSKFADNGIRLLRGSNVKRGKTDWSDDISMYWDSNLGLSGYVLREGDIVIAMDGSLVGRSFAQISSSDLPALLVQRVARLRALGVDQLYLKFWVCSHIFTLYCDSVKTVTAIPHISPQDIREFEICMPKIREEQTAIAEILSDMDSEIEALEKRLEKTKALKQGMMQELLTGRTRLV